MWALSKLFVEIVLSEYLMGGNVFMRFTIILVAFPSEPTLEFVKGFITAVYNTNNCSPCDIYEYSVFSMNKEHYCGIFCDSTWVLINNHYIAYSNKVYLFITCCKPLVITLIASMSECITNRQQINRLSWNKYMNFSSDDIY